MEKLVSSEKGPGIFYLLLAIKTNNLERNFYGLWSNWFSQKQLVVAVKETPSMYCDKLKKPTCILTVRNPVQILLTL
jgi:hypothetical protein